MAVVVVLGAVVDVGEVVEGSFLLERFVVYVFALGW